MSMISDKPSNNHSPRHPDGLNSPQSRRNSTRNPWSHVVRGDSESVPAAPSSLSPSSSAAIAPAPEPSVGSDRPEYSSPPYNSDDGNATAAKTKKPAWSKPVNGVVEVGSVMGAASWPALSESARASPKLTDSSKPLSDASVSASASASQGPLVASSLQKSVPGDANPTPIPNRASPFRQKSMKIPDREFTNSEPSPASPANQTPTDTPQSPNRPIHPVVISSPREVPHKGSNFDSGSRAGFVLQSHTGNDQPRNNFRRGNSGPHPRGDGHYHNNYGKRDQDRGSSEWSSHRNFSGRDVHMQQQRAAPKGYMRPRPTSAPFVTPMRPFGSPMGFPDIPSPVIYFPALHPDTLRGVPFIPHPGPPPIFFPGVDHQLRALLVKQIDYYFSAGNLCKDMYLRQNMDEQGWVPISLIAGFNRVKQLTTNAQFIMDAMQTSTEVEVQGDRIRKRNDWMNWTIPPANNFPTVSSPSTPGISNIDLLANQIQKVRLEEGATNYNLQAPLEIKMDGALSRSSSGESSHSSVIVGTSREGGMGQIYTHMGNGPFMSTRNSGKADPR